VTNHGAASFRGDDATIPLKFAAGCGGVWGVWRGSGGGKKTGGNGGER